MLRLGLASRIERELESWLPVGNQRGPMRRLLVAR